MLTAVRRQYGCARATWATARAARVIVALENIAKNVDVVGCVGYLFGMKSSTEFDGVAIKRCEVNKMRVMELSKLMNRRSAV